MPRCANLIELAASNIYRNTRRLERRNHMKRALIALCLAVFFCSGLCAQKIEKPTLEPKPCSDAQQQTVREGITFHDAKKYPEAAARYQQVLSENPDCTLAIYELTMTYYSMGEKTRAMETAYRGSKYRSDHLPLFYLGMANVLDDIGKPDEAVKIYRDALKMLAGDQSMVKHLSSIHYNLGLTLVKQKKYPDARGELKKAVEYNNQYASPHYLLAIVFNGTSYKIPAFLAAVRFLSLEFASQRSKVASGLVREILKPAQKDAKTGEINIFLNMNAPKDEGDFAMFDLLLGTLTTVKGKGDENKTEDELFVDAVATVIALVIESKDIKSTFVGKNYLDFVSQVKAKGYTDVVGYLVLHHSGRETATDWLTKNEAKLREFAVWSKTYSPPANK